MTDGRRFSRPLTIERALGRAELGWQSREVAHAFPGEESTMLFLRWMTEHGLGRKRLLDTNLAATYYCCGVRTLVTTNARDFAVFGCFELIRPDETP